VPSVDIREATIDDSALILRFVTELAIYEKAEHEVIATEADIKNHCLLKTQRRMP